MTSAIQDMPPFGVLVERHGNELLGYARRLAGEEAEDVLQDALLKALRSYSGLRHSNHLRAWLFRITTTTAIDHANRQNGRAEVPLHVGAEPVQPPSDDEFAFDGLIHGLPPDAQRALVLRFVQDLSYEEVASRLGCSSAAARQRVSTAVRRLRGRLT